MINKMNKKQLTEKILNHALGIVYLLTGEEYVVMKKNSSCSIANPLTGEIVLSLLVFADLQEDNLDYVSIEDAAEETGNQEDVEPAASSTEILGGEDNSSIKSGEQVEETVEDNAEEEGIIDVTDCSVVGGPLEESHQAACLEEEALQATYVSQDFQREGFTDNVSNNSYDFVNLLSNPFSDKHTPFPLGKNFLTENSTSWENVHIVRRKSRKQDLQSKSDYVEFETINEDQLNEFENDLSYMSCLTLHPETSTPFICGECGRSFTSELSLTEHMKNHSVEKPHRCNECGKEFEYRSRLIVHQKTHNGEKPHKCEVCGKDFNYRSRLLVHQRKHTGVKPHKCHQCGKQFDYNSHLLRHQRTHT